MPPLGYLKTETFYGQEVINSDDLNRKDYHKNQQGVEKTPIVQPLPKREKKVSKQKVGKTTPQADAALLQANKKDLNTKNIT